MFLQEGFIINFNSSSVSFSSCVESTSAFTKLKLVNNEFKQAGRYVVEFNGQNYASGVYFYRIEAGDFVQSKKMVLVK